MNNPDNEPISFKTESEISITYESPKNIGKFKYWVFCCWNTRSQNIYVNNVHHTGFRILGLRFDAWRVSRD